MEKLFRTRLLKAMELRNLSQADMVKQTGISKGALSAYMNGEYLPKQINTYKLAKALRVDAAWLMGKEVEMEPLPQNILPLRLQKVPMLGSISGGEPIFVMEQQNNYALLNGENDVDFCLQVEGNSMQDAKISDGDVVFVRRQPCVDNGEIAVVLIDDEATLKRFYKTEKGIILKPENPDYQPLFYSAEDFKSVRVLGKAVLVQTKL